MKRWRKSVVAEFIFSACPASVSLSFLLKTLFTLTALLLAIPAQADFRKALEAYQNRDGEKLLAEVRDAVEKKNDDGLMLFLMAMNLDASTSDYNPATKESNTTFRNILNKPQQAEMLDLLIKATNNSTVDTQYYLLAKSPFTSELMVRKYLSQNPPLVKLGTATKGKADAISTLSTKQFYEMASKTRDEYVERGSRIAMLTNAAEAELQTGLGYMNYEGSYGCNNQTKGPICPAKDEVKGYYWLKRATRSYQISGHGDFDLFPSVMCEFLRKTANGDKVKINQAYLWGLMGINERADISLSRTCLRHMHESGIRNRTLWTNCYNVKSMGSCC